MISSFFLSSFRRTCLNLCLQWSAIKDLSLPPKSIVLMDYSNRILPSRLPSVGLSKLFASYHVKLDLRHANRFLRSIIPIHDNWQTSVEHQVKSIHPKCISYQEASRGFKEGNPQSGWPALNCPSNLHGGRQQLNARCTPRLPYHLVIPANGG